MNNAVLNFHGNNNFISNSAVCEGGAIYAATNILLSFIGISHFGNNTAEFGGAIYTLDNVLLTFKRANNFINNAAEYVAWWYNLQHKASDAYLQWNQQNHWQLSK